MSKSELEDYRRAVGNVMGAIPLGIMNPLYEVHPSVKPKELA